MNQDIHERAKKLMADARAEGLSAADQAWLESHLADCAVCAGYAEQMEAAVRALRSVSVMPSPGLVNVTQLRVRARARELRERQARLRPLWVACAVAVLCSAITTPYLWWGFEWLGHSLGISDAFWQTGFVLFWAIPGILTAALLIAKETHFRAPEPFVKVGQGEL